MGRVQHDPAAPLEPRRARTHRKPRPIDRPGLSHAIERNRACAQHTMFPGAASSPHQREFYLPYAVMHSVAQREVGTGRWLLSWTS